MAADATASTTKVKRTKKVLRADNPLGFRNDGLKGKTKELVDRIKALEAENKTLKNRDSDSGEDEDKATDKDKDDDMQSMQSKLSKYIAMLGNAKAEGLPEQVTAGMEQAIAELKQRMEATKTPSAKHAALNRRLQKAQQK